MKTVTYIVKDLEDWEQLSLFILNKFPTKNIFLLKGNLGAGKTAFVQAFGKILGVAEHVTSPTFSILHEYTISDNQKKKIYHFDLYRLKNLQELKDIGFEDFIYSGEYCFIEWPDLVEKLIFNSNELKEKTLQIVIQINPETNIREVTINDNLTQ